MEFGVAKIGQARRIGLYFFANAFELPTADVFQVLAFGPLGCRFIEIYGNFKPLPDFFADPASDGNTVFESQTLNGNKGNDIGRAHARMCAAVHG